MKYLITLFLCATSIGVSRAQTPLLIWETDSIFSGPESVVYDPNREFLYISNLRKSRSTTNYYGEDFISKVDLNGKVTELQWIQNLTEPTGITIFLDELYIVERHGVVVYNLTDQKVRKKIRFRNHGFINDITVGIDSTIYVSESNTNKIYAVKNDQVKTWFEGDEIANPNGVLFDNDRLLVLANADSTLKAIDINSKQVNAVAQLPKGVLDGVKHNGDHYLISLLEGSILLVKRNGVTAEIINTMDMGIGIADFEYIESKKMLIIPALWQHKLVAFRLED